MMTAKQIVKKPPAKKHYVNNKALYEEMKLYKAVREAAEAAGKPKPRVPNYVGECLMMICTRLSHRPNFINYSYREDMVADGIENCIAAVDNFNSDKYENPFAFFTMIAWNAFIRRIDKEKKQAYIKHKNFVNSNLMEDINREMASTGTHIHNEYSDDIIRNFEAKLVKISKKTKSGLEIFVEDDNDEEPTPSTSQCT